MEIFRESKSICITCKYEKTCIYLKDTKDPIFHCEEYELVSNQISKEQNNKTKAKEELSPNEYTGICVNCDNRKECTIRCKTSVIWHCEEYK